MPSKAEQVAQRVVTVLAAANTGAIAVVRDRLDALSRIDTPVILVELQGEDSDSFSNSPELDQDLLTFSVCVCVRADDWQTVADAVRVQAHAQLVADGGLKLLLATSLRRTKADWRAADTDVPFGSINQLYQCKYLTRNAGLDL